MKRKTYLSDLSNQQWKLLENMLPPPELFGRKRSVNLREIINALCYLARSGCQWRMLPAIVERTFSWLNRNRRLSKDYERKTISSEAWIYFSMSILMLKRLKC